VFLSDRDLIWALQHGQLLVDPYPGELKQIGPTSIDLHLDVVEQAKIWNMPKVRESNQKMGLQGHELRIGDFDFKKYSADFLTQPKTVKKKLAPPDDERVFRRGDEIIVRPRGFLLWQTKERVGTPEEGAQLICFVDGKSTRARTGLVVHMTAPTIHAGWGAWPITLEIGNLGPFDFVLKEDDVIAQITVATISSIPEKNMRASGSVIAGQQEVGGQAQA
jgi:dCTP deaminase